MASKAARARKQKRKWAARRNNRKFSTAILDKAGVRYESRNDGAHLIILDGERRAMDFWPGTGLCRCRVSNEWRKGLAELLRVVAPNYIPELSEE